MKVKDQTATGGNLALKNNHATQTPVRVFRGSKTDGKIQYTYEGLYRVVEVKLTVGCRGVSNVRVEANGRL